MKNLINTILIFGMLPFILFCALLPCFMLYILGVRDSNALVPVLLLGNVTGLLGFFIYDKAYTSLKDEFKLG